MGVAVTSAAPILRHNERMKLLATALNNLALAFVGGRFCCAHLAVGRSG